jgi:hypothetical protein
MCSSAVVGMKPLGHVRTCNGSENAWKYNELHTVHCLSTTVIITKVSTGFAITRKFEVVGALTWHFRKPNRGARALSSSVLKKFGQQGSISQTVKAAVGRYPEAGLLLYDAEAKLSLTVLP